MKATSYKRITLFLCLVLLLALAAVGAIFGAGSTQASAATYTTPKYKTYGTTTEGTTTTSGSPSNFTIYMHGSSTSGTGTMYNDKLIDWSYVYIKIEVSAMSAHQSFKLTRNGSTYSSKTLSGNSNMTLYSGNLSSGEYELTYIGNYKRLCGNARNGAEINGDNQRVALLAHLPALAKRYERFVRALRESRTDQRNRSGQYRA